MYWLYIINPTPRETMTQTPEKSRKRSNAGFSYSKPLPIAQCAPILSLPEGVFKSPWPKRVPDLSWRSDDISISHYGKAIIFLVFSNILVIYFC
jgi:hypothetical protein